MLLSQQIQNVNIKTIVQKRVEKNLYQTAHEKQFEKGLKLHRRANIIAFSCISFLHFPFEFFFLVYILLPDHDTFAMFAIDFSCPVYCSSTIMCIQL